MTQKPIVFYTSEAGKERIRTEAKTRNISISGLVNLCVYDWLRANSILSEPVDESKKWSRIYDSQKRLKANNHIDLEV